MAVGEDEDGEGEGGGGGGGGGEEFVVGGCAVGVGHWLVGGLVGGFGGWLEGEFLEDEGLTNLKSVFMLRSIRPSPLDVHSSDHSFLWVGSMWLAKFWAHFMRADSA